MYASEKFFDAHLTPKGWEQCESLRQHLAQAKPHDGKESLVDRLELVVVSPLMRALETAVGCLGGGGGGGGGGVGDTSAAAAGLDGEIHPPLMIATEAVEAGATSRALFHSQRHIVRGVHFTSLVGFKAVHHQSKKHVTS